MHWVVAAPYFTQPLGDAWLTPFVPADKHQFQLIPAPQRTGMWHHRTSKTTDANEWKVIWRHGGDTLRAARARRSGIITQFPQLAAVVGLRQRGRFRRHPHVAWSFNLGQIYRGVKGRIAQAALAKVDRFIVHSRREIQQYSDWLGIRTDRFQFVPIQRADIPLTTAEDEQEPFILSMGSAARDYATFLAAVQKLNIKTVIVAAPHAIEGLTVPPNVTILSKLSADQCHELAQKARINIVPIANDQTASGQVTLVEAMTMGRPLIATRCMGSEDYIIHNQTGLLVEPHSVDAMASAIEQLWRDDAKRRQIGTHARLYARSHFSDEAVGAELSALLDTLQQ
ncbi:MAG TPA: glycosyltransferase [Tepidisphaeraceae bacterium]|jgi:glycosyltransferase involved in cell wall biosynthesis